MQLAEELMQVHNGHSDEGPTTFSEAATELRNLQSQRDELLETIKYAYNYAVDHDDRYPFDWALYCEMLYMAIKKVEQN